MYEVIDEQPEFLVVYKKPGASFHSETGAPGLFEFIKQRVTAAQLFPVHRLDKMTSGILLIAKSPAANRELSEAFRLRKTEKYYLAISPKKPTKKQGLVRGDMQPSRRGSWMLTQTLENPAVTQFFSKSLGDGQRLFIVKPHTGKTHQIRVVLKSLGAPILGDPLYADTAQAAKVDRGYLHAYSLGFSFNNHFFRYCSLPREGEHYLSENFTVAVEQFTQPWLLPWPQVPGSRS